MDQVFQPQPLPRAPLLKAARRLMRPLVRLMMHSGLPFPILADTLRNLFVEVAINDILTDPKTRTDSRISLLTGVHRKEIKRLRESSADSAEIPEVVTLISHIVARWVGSAAFTDDKGRPLPLVRSARSAGSEAGALDAGALNASTSARLPTEPPTFDSLVGSITTDVRPRAILDDLLAHGVVHMDSQDRIQLHNDAYIPRAGGEEQLFYFARNLHDHVAAAVANISASGEPPFVDRSVHYDRLTPGQAHELEEYARAAALRVLLEVNRKAMELAGPEPAESLPDHRRINFGIYVFGEREAGSSGEAS